MISAGWIVLALFIGVMLGVAYTGLVAGGSFEEKCAERCENCLLMHNLDHNLSTQKNSKNTISRTPPPPKHNWEITHVDKPTKSSYRKNGRYDRI